LAASRGLLRLQPIFAVLALELIATITEEAMAKRAPSGHFDYFILPGAA